MITSIYVAVNNVNIAVSFMDKFGSVACLNVYAELSNMFSIRVCSMSRNTMRAHVLQKQLFTFCELLQKAPNKQVIYKEVDKPTVSATWSCSSRCLVPAGGEASRCRSWQRQQDSNMVPWSVHTLVSSLLGSTWICYNCHVSKWNMSRCRVVIV